MIDIDTMIAFTQFNMIPIVFGTFIFLTITILAGWAQQNWIGLVAVAFMTLVGLGFAQEMHDINGAFFLNMATEIIGAVIVAGILVIYSPELRNVFVVIFVLLTVITLMPIYFTRGFEQSFWVNISTELLGSLVIFFLVREAMEEW